MASLVLGGIGYAVAGPVGFMVGSLLGNLLFPQKIDGPRLSDLKLQGSQYGQMIPLVYGTMRLAGQVVWQTDLTEHKHSGGGKGGPSVTTYTYSASFAIKICKGPIDGVAKIWRNGELIYDATSTSTTDNSAIPVTFYLGVGTEGVDPTMEAELGVGNVPAFRDDVVAVFTDWDLGEAGNTLPQLTFEVVSSGNVGAIPYRVNTTGFWSAAPFGSSAIAYGSYYLPGSDTVMAYQFLNTNVQYMETATTAATTATPVMGIATTPVTLATFPDGGIARSTVAAQGVITNTPAIFCFNVSDNTQLAWYYKSTYITAVTSNPWGFGVDPFYAVLGTGTFDGTFIYAPCFDPTTGKLGVSAWAAAGGVPSNGHFGCVDVSASSSLSSASQVIFGTSSTAGQFYIAIKNAGGGHGCDLYECQIGSTSIDVTYHWDQSDAAHTTPSEFQPQADFVRYHNYLAFVTGTGPTRLFDVMQINSDHSITPVGSIIIAIGIGVSRLRNGLIRGTDGVYSLESALDLSPVTLASIVSDLSVRSGLTAPDVDVTQLTDMVDGYMVTSQGETRAALDQLRQAYFFDAIESSGVIKFVKRGTASALTISDSDLAAIEASDTQTQIGPIVQFDRAHEEELPRSVTVKYYNINADWQTGAQEAKRQATRATAVASIELPIAMSDQKARQIANVLCYEPHLERNTFTFATALKYAYLEPTDVVTVHGYTVRIVRKTHRANGVIEFEAVETNTGLYQAAPKSAPADGFAPVVAAATQATSMVLLDIPMTDDLESPTSFQVAMAGAVDDTWRGGSLYQSKDSGSTYTEVTSVGVANVIGTCSTTLPNFAYDNSLDEFSSVTVVVGLGGGTLSSCTLAALYAGANLCVIGSAGQWEMLNFMTATLTAPDTYALTGLLRGRRGTEWVMSLHAASETFVLLPATAVAMVFGDLAKPYLYKAVTSGESLADASPVTFTNTGVAIRPYQPVGCGGGLNASGDVVANWKRRTRQGGEWQDYADVPMTEPSEGYVLEVWNSAYTLCARTILATTATATYTAAQQTADFGAAQQTYYLSVGQTGSYQLGRRARFTISGTGGSNNAPTTPITPYNGTTT